MRLRETPAAALARRRGPQAPGLTATNAVLRRRAAWGLRVAGPVPAGTQRRAAVLHCVAQECGSGVQSVAACEEQATEATSAHYVTSMPVPSPARGWRPGTRTEMEWRWSTGTAAKKRSSSSSIGCSPDHHLSPPHNKRVCGSPGCCKPEQKKWAEMLSKYAEGCSDTDAIYASSFVFPTCPSISCLVHMKERACAAQSTW